MLPRDRMLAACRGRPVDRPPLWLMRQAGRYLPEYRAVRKSHSFWEVVRTPELAEKVTLQPLARYAFDAAILFCDILIVLDALGAEVTYAPGGPRVSPQVRDAAALARLRRADASAFPYVRQAVERLCARLQPETAVIGFAGAPWTLAAYLVEGGPSKDSAELKKLAYTRPEVFEGVMDRIADLVAELLQLQIEAGVDVVQIFDTWAGHLCPADYRELAAPWVQRIISALAPSGVPIILYLRNAAGHLEAAAQTGCDVLSVDTSIAMAEARRRLPKGIALQGNLDPALLHAPEERMRQVVEETVAAAGDGGLILNLGQGLVPTSPPDGVERLVRVVAELGGRDG